MPSTTFLGYIIGHGRVEMEQGKLTVATEWPIPSNQKQLQHFLGFANYYCCFI